ncbi:hypothetical protein [Paraburkholderia sp. HD33-4]|uniref:hypothetical protein n=1 Tax=Paraburkholderia sp. HD33-4 TaxID=2883242 RepID=UPI001F157E93|nr:hypothetical protein [Paraburkholderia sp. HD33-4]
MTDITDLVERLRDHKHRDLKDFYLYFEAATALEQQAILITRLISQNEAQRVLISEHIEAQRKARGEALEEAANLCNTKGDEYFAAYKRSPVDDPRRGNPYVEGMSDGCSNCADAIRALSHAKEE